MKIIHLRHQTSLLHALSKTQLTREPNFSVTFHQSSWRSVTLICGALEEHLLTYLLTSQSFGNACSNHSHISLLLYCTTHVSHVTTISS